MPILNSLSRIAVALVLAAPLQSVAAQGGGAAGGGGGGNPRMREATGLDVAGKHAESRKIFQELIDAAQNPREKAAAQRAMARSAGFTGDCAMAIRYEEMVIAYHVTREATEPQDAFYQQGEMANEAARICADAGKVDDAERMYRRGSDLGNKQPEPRTHPRSLWDFRLAHALTRLAAQRGNRADAQRHMADARRALDAMARADTGLARQQERFFQYLPGYIALFTNDNAAAESEMARAVAIPGNDRDPQLAYFLGVAYERNGKADKAKEYYQKAYDMATAHNPPAAFARPAARLKLGLATP
jgi:tetratricopeptide (TPR) repeat protein